ncbi:armadillo-type protein [Gorgonomyces haynaldii]|nr:armadillo-type protein [Gorgonomyces haynaldii]
MIAPPITLKQPKQPKPVKLDAILPSFQKDTSEEKYVDFDKIIRFVSRPSPNNEFDRHVYIIDRLARIYREGVLLADWKPMATVILSLGQRIQEGGYPIMSVMEQLLSCIRPIEVLKDEQDICKAAQESAQSLIQALCSLLKVHTGNEQWIYPVIRSINTVIASSKADFQRANTLRVDFAPFSLQKDNVLVSEPHHKPNEQLRAILLEATENTDLVESVTTILKNAETQDTQFELLKCLTRLSRSNVNITTMLEQETFQVLSILMEQPEVTGAAIEIIWNGLEGNQANQVAQIMTQESALQPMKRIFDRLTLHGHKQIEKQMRNEMVLIFTTMVQVYPESAVFLLEQEVQDSATLFLTHSELNIQDDIVKDFVLTSSNDDHEFKRLSITLMKILAKYPQNLEAMIDDGLLDFSLIYLDVTTDNEGVLTWTPLQQQMLQIQILEFLSEIIPSITKEFREIDGYAYLIRYIDALIQNGKTLRRDHIDEVRTHDMLIQSCLRVFLTLTELGPNSKKILSASGIFNHLLALLSDQNQSTMVWVTSMLICSSLCQGFKANKHVFGDSGGVQVLIPFLTYQSADMDETERVILGAVECVWGTICGNLVYEDLFFKSEGIFHLLDLLEGATDKMKRHILGCVLDLLENPKAIYHLLQWRTKSSVNRGIAHLLVEMWNQEQDRVQAIKGVDGLIPLDEKMVLRGKKQAKIDLVRDGIEPDGGRAIRELQDNIRAKIYSMFHKLGFERASDLLSAEEKMELAVISKYLDFKIGEVWSEIAQEMKYERVRPISPDADCLNCVEECVQKKVEAVHKRQVELSRKTNETKKQEENQFFREWKELNIPPPLPPRGKRIHTWKRGQ